jgi:dolichol-phosphate mannosyltransferase
LSDSIVLIPTYNEIENIEKMVRTVMDLPVDFDVLIIDDSSPDGTGEKVHELQNEFERLHLLSRKGKEGLGKAYIAGFKWALAKDYELIYEMDCDFSHNPKDLVRLREACKNGADMAIGSRYVTGVNVVNWPISRVLLSYFASSYVRRVTNMPISDSTAGFVCFTRKVLETINLDKIKFKGYAFQIEMKFNAWKFGFNIQEVPIIFTDRSEGTSKMSKGIVKEAFFGVIELKIWSLFHNYKRDK